MHVIYITGLEVNIVRLHVKTAVKEQQLFIFIFSLKDCDLCVFGGEVRGCDAEKGGLASLREQGAAATGGGLQVGMWWCVTLIIC